MSGTRMRLTIVMPVYNEVSTIGEILSRVIAVPLEKEIIVVDDCSTDGTRAILEKYQEAGKIHVIFHEKNYGKGRAIRSALPHVHGDVVVIQDADLEYDPAELTELIGPIS